jgi:hypothetical protein
MLLLYDHNSAHLHSRGGANATVKAELLSAFGTHAVRIPQSLQCIRCDDYAKWDASGDKRQPLHRDYIWNEPFTQSFAAEVAQTGSNLFDVQVDCLLQRLATRGISVDANADTAGMI